MIRQPIVSVLGHVDHGKTSLLDQIRKSAVAAKESGGITQAIGATEVPLSTIKEICGNLVSAEKIKIPGLLFIDTPGHEAFTTLRRRGGSISDLAILVVDITEGMMPQTIESLTFLKEFKVPFVVAANKIDKIAEWKKNKTKSFMESYKTQNTEVKNSLDVKLYELVGELSQHGFDSERFDRVKDFKKIVSLVPTCTSSGEGIAELLAMLVGLSQQFLSQKIEIKSEVGYGSILEVKDVKGLGKTLDVILYDGKMKKGDTLIIGGKKPIVTTIKALLKPKELGEMRVETRFNHFDEVTAASGVKISAPNIEESISGSPIRSIRSKEKYDKYLEEVQKEVESVEIDADNDGILIRADTLGSLEAMIKILQSKKIPIRKARIGPVTKADIIEQRTVGNNYARCIFAFNVGLLPEAETLKDEIEIFSNKVIYKILEDYELWSMEEQKGEKTRKLEGVTRPGKIKLLPGFVFRASKPAVVGCEVVAGTITPGNSLVKGGNIVGKIEQIQKEGSNVKEAIAGDKVAVSIEGATVGRQIKEGDTLFTALSKEGVAKLDEIRSMLRRDEIDLLDEIKKLLSE